MIPTVVVKTAVRCKNMLCSGTTTSRFGSVSCRNLRGISFLVEGLSVDVPQTLLDKFPDTKLAKLARDNSGKDSEPIAIEVDLNHFRFLIDYMRHDKVVVPYKSSLTKESLLKTFQSFEFDDGDSVLSSGGGIQMENMPDLSEEVKESKMSTTQTRSIG